MILVNPVILANLVYIHIYFPLSYYKYNGGSSVNAPGRPSWMSSCLVSKMQRKRAATAFCSSSHVEKIWLY